jgi:phage terminase small subunit
VKLSPKESAFCRAMLTEKDQTAAALKAKYSPRTAASQASRLLKKVKIKRKIAELRAKADEKALVTRERIQAELALLAFADMKDYVTIGSSGEVTLKTFEEMPAGASRAIASIEETRRILGSERGGRKSEEDEEDDGDLVLEVKTKYRHHDKLGALKELSKTNGFYPEEGLGEAKVINYVFGNDNKK